jgi:7,8-dihydro-6-hydroxymethylpterin-pyrophosphokinase
LLLFGDRVVGYDGGDDASNHRHAGPVVPHPAMHRRAFVLIPLLDLAPDLRDPRNGRPFRAYLDALPPQGVYYYGACSYTTV